MTDEERGFRFIALGHAVTLGIERGMVSAEDIVKEAQLLVSFLRGDPAPQDRKG